MALGDAYEVVMAQRYLGQGLINVFTYYAAAGEGTGNWALALAQSFRQVWDTQAGGAAFDSVAFSNNLELMGIQVRNLFDPAEIAGILIGGSIQGANAGVNDNPFVAYRFSMTRGRGDMRNGQKYFGGLCVGAAVDGMINATNFAALSSVKDALDQALLEDSILSEAQFNPVIVKRVLEPETEEHKAYYRFPENEGEYVAYVANDWTAQEVLTTSNRRKIGRGV